MSSMGDTAGHRSTVSRRVLLTGLVGGLVAGCGPDDTDQSIPMAEARRRSRLPSKVIGLYCQELSVGQLPHVSSAFNVLYLFAATRAKKKSKGTLDWRHSKIDRDVSTCRKRGQRVILTIGGAYDPITFTSRGVSDRVVDSVVRINYELGGTLSHPVLDGVDFNTFEDAAAPDFDEYRWMSRELRKRFGQDFGITAPPAPWRMRDQEFCHRMLQGDHLDYVGPQFYDGPTLSKPEYIIEETSRWVKYVAGGDASKIVVGFGIARRPNYSTIQEISTVVRVITAEHPKLRGVFLWEDLLSPRPHLEFAREIAPYV